MDRCWTKINLKKMWTEGKLNDISTQLEASPKKLLHLLPLQHGLAKSTAHIVTKLLKLRPYKITVTQSHLPPDCKAKIQYRTWFQKSVFNGLLDPDLMFYSDKAWFILRR
jgi:hypothetical protein